MIRWSLMLLLMAVSVFAFANGSLPAPKINYVAATFWWNALLTVGLVVQGIYQWIASRDRVTRAAVDRVDQRVDSISDRVLVVEQRLPDKDTISDLYDRMGSLNREMGALEEKLKAFGRSLDRVEDHLMNRDN